MSIKLYVPSPYPLTPKNWIAIRETMKIAIQTPMSMSLALSQNLIVMPAAVISKGRISSQPRA